MIALDLQLRRGGFALEMSCRLGEATGLAGPSGSGKSSLLHALAGLIPVERLRLAIGDELLVDTAAGLVPPPHRRRIGLVFQDHRLFPHLSVRANLRYGLQPGGPAWDEVVDLLEIGALLDQRPDQCSGGQRQRIAIGRALLAGPRLLLLDEPLTSLDHGLKEQILPYLRAVRARFSLPLLMVSHDLGDLLAVSDELLLLEQGRLRGQGDLCSLALDPTMRPLLHDRGLVVAQPATVLAPDATGQPRLRLDGPAGLELICATCAAPPGARVDCLLRPEDIVLARGPVSGRLSVRNILPGRVQAIAAGATSVLVAVDAGATQPFLAEVAPGALHDLELAPGVEVSLLCKAAAIGLRP